MKRLLKCINVLLLSACTGAVSYGKAVDENTAKTIGCNFLINDGVPGVKSAADLSISYTTSAAVNGKSVVDYYVFNINNGNGFVMVSGDDNVLPILAYSRESSFDINNISPSTKFWIEGYQNQITAVIANNIPADAATIQNWNVLKVPGKANVTSSQRTTSITFPSSTQFLLGTKWDQGSGYNTDCPGSGSTKAVTGCVATCMSEIMQFWNWPTVGTGSHTYTPPAGFGYPAQTADFGNTAYNWTSMDASLTAGNAAIATLMYHAGVSVEMNYSPTESGAYVISMESATANCAQFALQTYFHYKTSMQGIPRFGEYYPGYTVDSIPQATWISMLKTELNAQRPIIYSGEEPADAGGHCWVCDGYKDSLGSTWFHFNWGWSGASNGFYTVNNLAPPALGIGAGSGNFNADQCAIIGIIPDSFPATSGNVKLLAHLNCTTSQGMAYNSPFSIVTKVLNSNTATIKDDFCAQVFDMSGNLAGTINTISAQTITAGDSLALTFSTTGMLGLIPLDYYSVQVMCRANGTTTWSPVASNGTFINYNVLDIDNSQSLELGDSMHIGSHTIISGHTLTFTTHLTEVGTTAFTGIVQASLINVATGTSTLIQQYTGQTITSGAYISYTFSNTVSVPTGTYVLAVQHEPTGTSSYVFTGSDYYENPVIIYVGAPAAVSTLSQPVDNIQVYPNPASEIVNIALNGVEVSDITITDIQGRQVQKMTPVNGQPVVTIPVSNFAPGIYFARMQAGSDVITKKIVVTK